MAVVVALDRAGRVRHPEYWMYLAALLAAGSLVVRHVVAAQHVDHHHHEALVTAPPTEWVWWMVMVVAMMLPIVAPAARRIAFASLWSHRQAAMAEFLVGYLAVWAIIGGVALATITAVWEGRPPPIAVVIALLVAAGWQTAPPRRVALRRCGASASVAVLGWPAVRDCIRSGWQVGLRCAMACVPVMIAMALSHNLILMLCLTAVLFSERARGPNPARRAARPQEAWSLAALAACVWAVM